MLSSSGIAAAPLSIEPHPYRLRYSAASDTGMVRRHNEDRFGALEEAALFLVADGMGGAAAGEIAAEMAVELVSEAFVDPAVPRPPGLAHPANAGLPRLVAAIERANRFVYGAAMRVPDWKGMGTTLAAALFAGSRAALAHVGDSRIYRLRGGRLESLTEDHSLFAELVRAGFLDPDDGDDFPNRNVITRAIGSEPTVAVEARLVDVAPNDTFLLCSDGLSGVVPHAEIAAVLREHGDLDEAVAMLVARANELGGPDNVTVVAVRCEMASGSWPRAW